MRNVSHSLVGALLVLAAVLGQPRCQNQTGRASLIVAPAASQSIPSGALGVDQRQYYILSTGGGNGFVELIRSENNGETFLPPQSIGAGLSPVIAVDGATVVIMYQGRLIPASPKVVVRVSHDHGATFSPELELSASSGGNLTSQMRVKVEGSVITAAWVRQVDAYVARIDASVLPPVISSIETVPPAGAAGTIGSFVMDADGANVIVGWREGVTVYGAFRRLDTSGTPPVVHWTSEAFSAGSADSVSVAVSQGRSIVVWSDAIQVGCARWDGPTYLGVSGVVGGLITPLPPPPYVFYDMPRVRPLGSNFHVLCRRNENGHLSGTWPGYVRVYAASCPIAGGTWSGAVVDSDPLVSPRYVERLHLAVSGSGSNEALAAAWERQDGVSGASDLRFAKSLDSGVTWKGNCSGDPACSEPIYLFSDASCGGLYLSDSSAVILAYNGSTGSGIPVGYYSSLVAGHRRYQVCDAGNPSACGGSPETRIEGNVIPWTAPAVGGEVTTSVILSYPPSFAGSSAVVVLGFNNDRLYGNQPSFGGLIPHIDLTSPVIYSVVAFPAPPAPLVPVSVPVVVPNCAVTNAYGIRVFLQGVFLDLGLNVLSWTDGLELRVN